MSLDEMREELLYYTKTFDDRLYFILIQNQSSLALSMVKLYNSCKLWWNFNESASVKFANITLEVWKK